MLLNTADIKGVGSGRHLGVSFTLHKYKVFLCSAAAKTVLTSVLVMGSSFSVKVMVFGGVIKPDLTQRGELGAEHVRSKGRV